MCRYTLPREISLLKNCHAQDLSQQAAMQDSATQKTVVEKIPYSDGSII